LAEHSGLWKPLQLERVGSVRNTKPTRKNLAQKEENMNRRDVLKVALSGLLLGSGLPLRAENGIQKQTNQGDGNKQRGRTPGGKRLIVDVHTHINPPIYAKQLAEKGVIDTTHPPNVMFRYRGFSLIASPDFMDVGKLMRVSAEAGVTYLTLGQAMMVSQINDILGVPTIDVAKRHNDFFAQLKEQYPKVMFPLGTVKPHDGKEAVREAERCIEKLGFKGLTIESSYGVTDRQYNHTSNTFDFWEYVNDRKIPVFIHPPALSYGWEWMDRYRMEESVARPHDTGLNASFMIMSGLFDRFPNLRIILSHMGGSLLMVLPRLEFSNKLGYAGMVEYQKATIRKTPMEYVKEHIWVDTMGFYPPGIKHALELLGADHVLFGTDYGPVPISPKEHIDIVLNQLGLSKTDQEKVLGLNAKGLLNLPDPA
jgi:aminocarboxymuconate-semialdehyde decarboxylase